jgi:FkbM family methyltransferase
MRPREARCDQSGLSPFQPNCGTDMLHGPDRPRALQARNLPGGRVRGPQGPVRSALKRALRAVGYDIVRLPPAGTMEHHLQQLLERLDVNCVVDVGARVGDYAALCRRLGYEGRIVSFEPATENHRDLSERARGDDRWIVVQAALGGSDERRALNISASSDLNSFLERNDYNVSLFGEAGRIVGREVVDVQRLDSVLPPHVADLPEPRIFLKIDTQGWDIEVMRGAGGVLPLVVALHVELAVRPIYEGAVTYLEALRRLETGDLELSGLFPGVSEGGLRVVEFECFMTKAGPLEVPRG